MFANTRGELCEATGSNVFVVRDGKLPEGEYEGVWVTGPFDLNEGNLLALIRD